MNKKNEVYESTKPTVMSGYVLNMENVFDFSYYDLMKTRIRITRYKLGGEL